MVISLYKPKEFQYLNEKKYPKIYIHVYPYIAGVFVHLTHINLHFESIIYS